MSRKVLISLGVVAALGASLLGGYLAIRKARGRISPFSNMKPGIAQSGGRLSYEQAAPVCPISLPASASNVQWGVWSLWRASATFVRFEDAPEKCAAHARALLTEDLPSGDQVVTAVITSPPPTAVEQAGVRDLDLTWFDLDRLTNGILFTTAQRAGFADRPLPTIHVDVARGVFYYVWLK